MPKQREERSKNYADYATGAIIQTLKPKPRPAMTQVRGLEVQIMTPRSSNARCISSSVIYPSNAQCISSGRTLPRTRYDPTRRSVRFIVHLGENEGFLMGVSSSSSTRARKCQKRRIPIGSFRFIIQLGENEGSLSSAGDPQTRELEVQI